MKKSNKIVAILLAATTCLGAFTLTGCKSDKTDGGPDADTGVTNNTAKPAELFVNALTQYNASIESNTVYNILSKAFEGGSANIKLSNTPYDIASTVPQDTSIDATIYFDASGNAVSFVANAAIGEEEFDAQMLLSDTKIVLASNLLEEKYGINLETAKDNFANSLFGTKGANLLDLTEEDEEELLNALDDVKMLRENTAQSSDADQLFMDTFTKYATFTSDTETPYTIDGQSVDNTTVTATISKNALWNILNDTIVASLSEEILSAVVDSYNEEYDTEFESLNDIFNDTFADYQANDAIITYKLVLDKKYNAIMAFEVYGGNNENSITVVLGSDPQNITNVKCTVVEDGETSVGIISINEESTKTTIDFRNDQDKSGTTIVCDKAHKTVTIYNIDDDGIMDEENAVSFTYELTENSFAVSFDADDVQMTVTFKTNDKSPVSGDNYKDLLTMTQEDMDALIAVLAPYMAPDTGTDYDDEDWIIDDGFEGEFDSDF